MKRVLVLCALGPMVWAGCSPQGEHVLQLIPSPNGAYQAIAVECGKGESTHSTVLKVIPSGQTAACATKSLQEITLTSGSSPRLTWMSDDTLVIDERGAPTRPPFRGEVSFVFAPWQATLAPPEPKRPATTWVARSAAQEGVEHEPSARAGMPMPPVAGQPLSTVPPVADGPACGIQGLKLPADFSVLAGGGSSGKRSSVQIDQSGHEATTMAVSVDNPGKPVVLMLGAYEPTVWSIRRSPNTTLLAVLVSGYHRQIVAGLEPTTPVAIHTNDNKSSCGYFYVDTQHLEKLNPMARQFFGHDIDMVYPARDGEVTLGVSSAPPSAWVGTSDVPIESYVDKTAPLAGEEGLDEAVRKGLMRRANISDKEEWDAQMERLLSKHGSPPVAGARRGPHFSSSLMLRNAYVVLRPMTLPAGLYGAHSAVFFIPKGTERPRGNPGHSTLYDFNDLSCTGVECSL